MKWKQSAYILFLFSLLLVAVGCGDDDATGPGDSGTDQRLVAEWQFASTDLSDRISEKLILFLQGTGASEEEIAAAQQELLSDEGNDAGFFSDGYAIALDAGGTWTDSDGDTGTWRTSGDRLTVDTDGGGDPSLTFRYALSGATLTLNITAQQVAELMALDPQTDAETIAFFELFFPPEEEFSIVMTRLE